LLFLLFRLGEDLYALEASRIGEVLPLVRIKALPGAPTGIAGLINHRGSPVPVLDLSMFALGRPSPPKLSTRIVLMRDAGPDGAPRWLGLILEQATNTLRRNPGDFVTSGLGKAGTSFLGPVLADGEHGLIQWIDPRKLLPEAVKEMLFHDLTEEA
jgi:chemotaxis-related protein WspB